MRVSKLLAASLALGLMLALAGCGDDEGPAEKTGEKIDEAVEQAGEKVEEATDEMGGKMEEAGDEVQESTN
jgi:hypothetical protein